MSISPQQKSNEPSRPASPAADALEMLSLDDEAFTPEETIKMKANYRKTSSWKGLKTHLSKAEMKIKSTFTDNFSKERNQGESINFFSPASDGTIISPIEISPGSEESNNSMDLDERIDKEKSDKITDIIKNIEELGSEIDKETTSRFDYDKKQNLKKVDFAEEIGTELEIQTSDGPRLFRPIDLDIHSKDTPIAPPRMRKDGPKRLERLFSVPNIKLDKSEQSRLLNLRKTSNIVDQKSNKNKGNFIRRFSKYLSRTSATLIFHVRCFRFDL